VGCAIVFDVLELVELEFHLFGVSLQYVVDNVLERYGDDVGDDEFDAVDDHSGDDSEYDEHDEYDECDECDEYVECDECDYSDVVNDDDNDEVDDFN